MGTGTGRFFTGLGRLEYLAASMPSNLCRRAGSTLQVATIALQERAIMERSMLAEQLQAALRTRVVIEQAKGMLAEYLPTTVDDASGLLRKYARSQSRADRRPR